MYHNVHTHAHTLSKIKASAVTLGYKVKKKAEDTVALSWTLAMLHSKVLTEKDWKLRMDGIAEIETGLTDKKIDVPSDIGEKLTLCKDKSFQAAPRAAAAIAPPAPPAPADHREAGQPPKKRARASAAKK